MRKGKFSAVVLLCGALGAGLVACEHKGPAERAGEKIDDAARDVKRDAQKAADKVEDAAQDVKDKAQDRK